MSASEHSNSLTPGRVAVVGTGSRGLMFVRGIAERPPSRIVALCDLNTVRAEYYNQVLHELGQPPVPFYKPEQFREMLDKEKVDTVIVSCVDQFHDLYIVPAVEAGVQVLTEKPMTVNVQKCRRINQACNTAGQHITVTFNYRYNPTHELVKSTIASGEIGKVISVHFEWLLDTVHGADFFKRWHAQKENSGGLMVCKSGHHFDLVNWWLDAAPTEVAAMGRLAFYGDKNGKENGWARDYKRSYGTEAAKDDPFALLNDPYDTMSTLYSPQANSVDGYERDRNCFQAGIDIEDDIGLLVRYDSGAVMTYHLTAYSPWEGYRVMFNGTKGRLELEVVENTHRLPPNAPKTDNAGPSWTPFPGPSRVTLHPLWQKPRDLPILVAAEGEHGGGDERMLNVHFGPKRGGARDTGAAADQMSTERDGTAALAVGLAANVSMVTGEFVKISDLRLDG